MTREKQSNLKTNERFMMPCPNCGKMIAPITYFTGELYCPECKEAIANKISEAINAVEDPCKIGLEYFRISQQFFIKYLLDIVPAMRKLEQNKEEYDSLFKQGQKYLRQAVTYCKRAAFMGNPYALVNLVYYYKTGYDVTVSNRDLAAKKLSAVTMGIYKEYTKKPEISEWVKAQLESQTAKAPALQGGSDLQYLKKLIQASQDKGVERKPLFGVFSINFDSLSDAEKKECEELLQEASELWRTKNSCGLYRYDASKFRWSNFKPSGNLPQAEGIIHFGYRNGKCHSANRRMKLAMKEVIAAKENMICDFFTEIVIARNMWPDNDRTIGFCDVDIYLCPDNNKDNSKIDDLQKKLNEVLRNNTER